MIGRMKTASRLQRRYDYRLRDVVRRTGDLTTATDLGVPRSTARGWLATAPRVVISGRREPYGGGPSARGRHPRTRQ